jgi:chemotaxis protein CheC
MAADTFLNELEKDALKEIVNIAFGEAAANLAEIIGLYVFLNVPRVEILQPERIEAYIDQELEAAKTLSIVEQYYIGKIRGAAFLVFPFESGRQLLTLFGGEKLMAAEVADAGFIERETLMEVANIIIGVCVSRLAELLQDAVTYLPPRYLGNRYDSAEFSRDIFTKEAYVILLKTVFHFENREVNGYLFLVNSYESISWLKKAIDEFIASYL